MDIPVLINPRFQKTAELQQAITVFNNHQHFFRLSLILTELVADVGPKDVIDQNQLYKNIERAGYKTTCVIVEKPLKYDLFSDYRRQIYVFTTGDSAANYAPLPVTLYLIFMLACGLSNLACELPQEVGELCIHDPDIGCISDYNSDKKGIRFSMMNAHICEACKTVLKAHRMSDEALDAIQKILEFISEVTKPYLDKEPKERKVRDMIAALNGIPLGKDGASAYHGFILEALATIFGPNLLKPVKEGKLDDGRKRVDIIFNNKARTGFFFDLVTQHQVKCGYVYVECKNYSTELANPEVDQLLGRLNRRRGMFGMIVCRHIENRDETRQRCKDALSDDKYIVLLDDLDIKALLGFRFEQNADAIDDYMDNLFRRLIM